MRSDTWRTEGGISFRKAPAFSLVSGSNMPEEDVQRYGPATSPLLTPWLPKSSLQAPLPVFSSLPFGRRLTYTVQGNLSNERVKKRQVFDLFSRFGRLATDITEECLRICAISYGGGCGGRDEERPRCRVGWA